MRRSSVPTSTKPPGLTASVRVKPLLPAGSLLLFAIRKELRNRDVAASKEGTDKPIRFSEFNRAVVRCAKPVLAAFVRVLSLQKPAILPLHLRQEIGFLVGRQVPIRGLDVQDTTGVREIELRRLQACFAGCVPRSRLRQTRIGFMSTSPPIMRQILNLLRRLQHVAASREPRIAHVRLKREPVGKIKPGFGCLDLAVHRSLGDIRPYGCGNLAQRQRGGSGRLTRATGQNEQQERSPHAPGSLGSAFIFAAAASSAMY